MSAFLRGDSVFGRKKRHSFSTPCIKWCNKKSALPLGAGELSRHRLLSPDTRSGAAADAVQFNFSIYLHGEQVFTITIFHESDREGFAVLRPLLLRNILQDVE